MTPADTAVVAEAAAAHCTRLFGESLPRTAIHVRVLAGGTRGVFEVVASGHLPLVAKRRVPASPDERTVIAAETSHEFALLATARTALDGVAPSHLQVPRAVLALPDDGLLFMQRVPGRPVAHTLARWLRGGASRREVARLLERCGEWLMVFVGAAPAAWPLPPAVIAKGLAEKRARHHVYRLVGLQGEALVTTAVEGARRRLSSYAVDDRFSARITSGIADALSPLTRGTAVGGRAVHGKFSPADILIDDGNVHAVDFEQAGHGCAYLDPAYFLYQVYMVTRWRPFGWDRAPARAFRQAFLSACAPAMTVDDAVLDGVIAYYLVNSLRPGGGIAGARARSYASRWLDEWIRRVGI